MKLFQRLVAEARADMSDISPRVVFPNREDESAEKRPGASRRREARDHNFLSFRGLDLQPVGRSASGCILAIRALCHDAFKTFALGFGKELLAAALAMIAEGDQRVARQYGLKPLLAFEQREAPEVFAVREHEIECAV